MNKAQIAEHFDVALTTVDHWIRRGCPVVSKGSKGRDWDIDPEDVMGWRQDRDIGGGDPHGGPTPMEGAKTIIGAFIFAFSRELLEIKLRKDQTEITAEQVIEATERYFLRPEVKKAYRDVAGILGAIEKRQKGRPKRKTLLFPLKSVS